MKVQSLFFFLMSLVLFLQGVEAQDSKGSGAKSTQGLMEGVTESVTEGITTGGWCQFALRPDDTVLIKNLEALLLDLSKLEAHLMAPSSSSSTSSAMHRRWIQQQVYVLKGQIKNRVGDSLAKEIFDSLQTKVIHHLTLSSKLHPSSVDSPSKDQETSSSSVSTKTENAETNQGKAAVVRVLKPKFLRLFKGFNMKITSIDGHPHQSKVVMNTLNQFVDIWDYESGQRLSCIPPMNCYGVASADSHQHLAGIRQSRYSNQGRLIVTTSNDHTAKVWSADTGVWKFDLAGDEPHTAEVKAAAFSPNDKIIATVSLDGSLKVWSAESGQMIFSRSFSSDTAGELTHVLFSPNGQFIILGGRKGRVIAVSAANGEPVKVFENKEHISTWLIDMAISKNGAYLLTSSLDKRVYLWDFQTGEKIKDLSESVIDDLAVSVSFSRTNKYVLVTYSRGDVELWTVGEWKLLHQFKVSKKPEETIATGVFAAHDDRMLFSIDDKENKTVHVYDLYSDVEL